MYYVIQNAQDSTVIFHLFSIFHQKSLRSFSTHVETRIFQFLFFSFFVKDTQESTLELTYKITL